MSGAVKLRAADPGQVRGGRRQGDRLASYKREYHKALGEERHDDAASWAGAIAVLLERVEHPSSKSWWERQRKLEELA